VQKQPETIGEQRGNTLIQYRAVNAIFETIPVEGTTVKGRTIHVNEAQRDNYPAVLTYPPSLLTGPFILGRRRLHHALLSY